jgi:hypothetical protein
MRHLVKDGINRNVLYTDGAQRVAEHGGAYGLLNEIAIIQPHNKAVAEALEEQRDQRMY